MNEIILYPGNWLYNAGVVGFLRVLSIYEKRSVVESWIKNDGTVTFAQETFREFFTPVRVGSREIPKVQKYYIDYYLDSLPSGEFEGWLATPDENGITPQNKYKDYAESMGDFGYRFIYFGNKFFGTNAPFQNLVQFQEWRSFEFSRVLQNVSEFSGQKTCDFCGLPLVGNENPKSMLEKRLVRFQYAHFPDLGPSDEFPNAFWETRNSFQICPLCVYFLLHWRLAFVPLADRTKIFLNAPSFQVMWHLRRLVEELYEDKQIASAREILGMSLIELALRLQIQLGVWTGMNIEIVSRRGDEFSFYTLPYEVVQLLLDREVASLLSEIGELSILRMVLDRQFRQILEVGERLLAIALKPERTWGKQERQYVNDNIHLGRNKKAENLAAFSYQLFSLYALIQEKVGGDEW